MKASWCAFKIGYALNCANLITHMRHVFTPISLSINSCILFQHASEIDSYATLLVLSLYRPNRHHSMFQWIVCRRMVKHLLKFRLQRDFKILKNWWWPSSALKTPTSPCLTMSTRYTIWDACLYTACVFCLCIWLCTCLCIGFCICLCVWLCILPLYTTFVYVLVYACAAVYQQGWFVENCRLRTVFHDAI